MAKAYSKEQSTYRAEREKKEAKKPKPIAKISEKMKHGLKNYGIERKKYLEMFSTCEVEGCLNESTTIHHKAGRLGVLLTDTNNLLACCMPCHMWIESHPLEAKEKGYSLNRL